jgi:hypothetical protein
MAKPTDREGVQTLSGAGIQPFSEDSSRAHRPGSLVLHLALLAVFTLLLHLPFVARPVQGDEVNYIDIARHILDQPLTPLNFQYVFQGVRFDMAGHLHPPLNAYLIAMLWWLRGDFSPAATHAAYLLFSIATSFGAYALAARFTRRPLWVALLVASAPAVQVAANTVESDAPAVAFLVCGAALFLAGRWLPAAVALSLAGLTALQTLVIVPILLFYFGFRVSDRGSDHSSRLKSAIRNPKCAMAAAAPFLVWGAWQLVQFALLGRLPVAVMGGYLASSAHWGRLGMKAASVAALVQHLGVLVVFMPLALFGIADCGLRIADCGFLARLQSAIRNPKSEIRYMDAAIAVPGLLIAILVSRYAWWERLLLALFFWLGIQTLRWLWARRFSMPLPAWWCLAYFGFALAAFFAGSARYLLPLAVPLAILVVRELDTRPGRLAAALVINIALGLALSHADYEFARTYAGLEPPPGASFLVNGEWGFRYQMTRAGGRMIEPASVPAPGEWIVVSDLCLGAGYDSAAEAAAVRLKSVELRMPTPLRLVDRYARSGYSSSGFGLLPFSFSRRPLDRITYYKTSPYLFLDAPWLPTQFSGRLVYLPRRGATIRLPLDPATARLHFALFARGSGPLTFTITGPSGEALYQRSVEAGGQLWVLQQLPLGGRREIILSIDAPPGVQAGWGELVPW